ncbi:helix-turn-helix transcriptional regulator [Streptomyces sp. I05A-00742]|uniref:helix-turn-helix domain-containing protein n=1 Tax=Streptomyces sp. I05A-00742 TaxID=2732853 RepID=UPI00148812D5|nr:helix-turn-helix transcriptional regulator [Streptomyces sp. I05A-00742]
MPAPKRIEPTNLNEWFGAKIRELREARGWTQARLGEAVRLSGSRIAQFERAEDVPPKDITELLDEALGAGGLLVEMRPLLDRSWDKKWPEEIDGVEEVATRIQQYTYAIPGFFQTPEYATSMLSEGFSFFGGDLNARIRVRLSRPDVMAGPFQPWIRCVMDESALYRAVCPPAVMHDQLLHLLKSCEQPRVSIQILPFSNNRIVATALGLATVWTLADGRTVVYQESMNSGHFVTKPSEVALYTSLLDQFQADALPTQATMDFIRGVLEDRYS